jgi:hypothetical protein
MPTELPTDSRKKFVPRILPWLLAAAMLAVYVLTLNHWVSLFNLVAVAKISGWMWQPDVFNPITFLVIYPLRWVPEPSVPFTVNLFSAVCAALTLGLLARSVAVLPHDRTDAQRNREKSDFSILTIRSAWLPPVLAVAVCGLQLTFWEHATNFTSEMLDLLPFAFVIWLLLEYRMDERVGRLYMARAWRRTGRWWDFSRCLSRPSSGAAASDFSIQVFWAGWRCAGWWECCYICCCR